MNDQSILKAVKLLQSLTPDERLLVIRLTKPKASAPSAKPAVKRRRRKALGTSPLDQPEQPA